MNSKRINKILVMLTLGLWFAGPLFADAPYEKYHVTPESISKVVLRDTIGILTIVSGADKTSTELNTYSRTIKSFTYSKKLKISETTPVSNFGYQDPQNPPSSSIDTYRYPIVAKSGQYLCIVYDPIKNKRAWINIKETEANFHSSIVMLENIETPSSFFIDIFYLAKKEGVKLYKEPSKNAGFTLLIDEQKYSLLRILEQKGNFIRIGIVKVGPDTNPESVESIGWIRIRDEQNMLMIWVKDEDLC